MALELPTPTGAKTYLVPPITAWQYWALHADGEPWPTIAVTRTSTPDDMTTGALTDELVAAMADDGVLDVHVRLAAQAVVAWHATGDPDAAAQVWAGTEPDLRPVTADELDLYGVGPQNANGDYLEYDLPPEVEARLNRKPDDGLTLAQVWEHADVIAADLLSEYRLDVAGRMMHRRSGPWLRRLVDGLLMADTRVARLLYAERNAKGGNDADHAQG